MIKLYTTPSCAYCKLAKGFFKAKDIDYIEIDVVKDAEARANMITMSGSMAVPVIEINGEMVVGFDRLRIERLLGLGIEK